MPEHKNRKNIALLTSYTGTEYIETLSRGVTDFAAGHNVNCYIHVGGTIHSPLIYERNRNIVFEMLNSGRIDGVIVFSQLIARYVGPEEMREFCRGYSNLPVLSVGMALEGIPSIILDNTTGMRELMVHLIEHHGYRRFAMISGPPGNIDAADRYYEFIRVLRQYKIPVDPELVIQSDFGVLYGREAVRILLEERKRKFDCIVAASDDIALGAMTELESRGFSLPDDVAVTGFDNINAGLRTAPALTTVSQPICEFSKQAARLLYAHLVDPENSLPPLTEYPTHPVIRESCGCRSDLTTILQEPGGSSPAYIIRTPLQKKDTADTGMVNHWVDEVSGAFTNAVKKKKADIFLNELKRITADENFLTGTDMLIRLLHGMLLKYMASLKDRGEPAAAVGIWVRGVQFVEDLEKYREIARDVAAVDIDDKIRDLAEAMEQARDLKTQMDVVPTWLPRLGIETCYLYVYDEPEKDPFASRLILAYNPGGRITDGPDKVDARGLVPQPEYFKDPARQTLLVEPLFFGTQPLGFIVFNLTYWDKNNYEFLRQRISYCIAPNVYKERIRGTIDREEIFSRNRIRQLSDSNEELRLKLDKLQDFITEKDIPEDKRACEDFRIQRALDYIKIKYNADLTLEGVAGRVFMSPGYFSSLFKRATGKNFSEYLTSVRIQKALSLLRNYNLKVSEISSMVGYHDPNYFTKVFKKIMGISPAEYVKNNGNSV
ncbi:MAG: substrate-binding domain-containing protein [Spirochaetales bacterium]|nr:substrate-binding domain-containing protein [Spirochaetales bacterium]